MEKKKLLESTGCEYFKFYILSKFNLDIEQYSKPTHQASAHSVFAIFTYYGG